MEKQTKNSNIRRENREILSRIVKNSISTRQKKRPNLNQYVDFDPNSKKSRQDSSKCDKVYDKMSKKDQEDIRINIESQRNKHDIDRNKIKKDVDIKQVFYPPKFTDKNKPQWGKANEDEKTDTKPVEKEKPNFGLSGALLKDSNMVNGIIVKYNEPPDAHKPTNRWRLYPFKEDSSMDVMHIHRQSCYLIGKEKKVTDILVRHPSISKQHAVIQYRQIPIDKEDLFNNDIEIRPYLIDLASTNGTYLNDSKMEPQRFYQMKSGDLIKFGFSTRDYVIMQEDV